MAKYFVFTILLTIFLFSCNISSPPSYLPYPEKTEGALQLFSSGDIRGNLEPCGCKSGQIGGLPRQAQYFLQHHPEQDVLVDLGNSMADEYNAYEIFKWYYILLTYQKMGYHAVNIGRNEVRLSKEELSSMRQRVAVPLVSANVVDNTQTSVVLPYTVAARGAIKIAISGIVSPESKTGDGLAILPIEESLEKYLPKMIAESHVIIILANVTTEQANTIASRFPEISLILTTGLNRNGDPEKIGSVVISDLTALGRYVNKISFQLKTSGELSTLRKENIRLGSDIQDHPGTVHLLQRYRQELAEKRFYTQGLSQGDRYAGSDRCAMCHPGIHATWKNTTHSHSLESLKRKHNEHDPQCLKCHVTGFGMVSGYVGEVETPDMGRIGCEVCHGASYRHAHHNNPQEHRPSPGNASPKDVCLECHSWEHCGNFDYATFWARIAHKR